MTTPAPHAAAAAAPRDGAGSGHAVPKQPVDQEIRSAATTDLHTCFFLEAGAGTARRAFSWIGWWRSSATAPPASSRWW